jgi:hypothetical protein
MDAVVTVEQLKDFYLENENDNENWDYLEVRGDYEGSFDKLIPAHNGFGSAFHKKAFVIWMHF